MVSSAQRTFQMLENESLWKAAKRVHGLLSRQKIEHAIVGGVAVCLHGYRRNTVDIDLLIRAADTTAVKTTLEGAGFTWSAADHEFRAPPDLAIHCVMAGDREGPDQDARFPDPDDMSHVTEIEGFPVLSLAQLIQSKLAWGIGDMRRTHKDFADVVELIAIQRLDNSFARHLHKSVRKEFRALVRRAAGA